MAADGMNTMWCDQCRQDVPAVGAADEGKFCCPRCGIALCTQGDLPPGKGEEAVAADVSDPPLYDTWELDQRLQHIERMLHARGIDGTGSQADAPQEWARVDSAHDGPSPWHLHPATKPVRTSQSSPAGSWSAMATLTVAALSLGTLAFVAGGVLLGWSVVAGRAELWTMGMPIAIGGQITLLVGLVLQINRLWRDSRHAVVKLDAVDEQLHQLNAATTMLGTGHSSPSGAFYSHLAGGANPQLLLSDLKSQLDLLALKIGQEQW